MLQPNELRIGNAILIEIFPAPPQWHFVKAKDILDIADGRITLESISGIPLTPEVLERCGLQRDREGWIMSFYFKLYDPLELNGVGVYGQVGRNIYQVLFKNNIMQVPVKYIHQLQNLVFALTGQELKISEK